MRSLLVLLIFSAGILAGGSQQQDAEDCALPMPHEIIDLGALVTEDLPERVWGRRYLTDRGWTRQNVFDVMPWRVGPVNASNSYYTFFNHGGPHVDAPNHIGLQGGIDSYPVESFAGPLRLFDVSHLPPGRTVTKEFLVNQGVGAGDIVMIYTSYRPPETDNDYPKTVTLTRRAAEYLANIPVRAFATDSWSVGISPGDRPAEPPSDPVKLIPVHDAFLSRGIPIYESLFNVDRLLGKENMYFVGPPLNIENGDGMIVRPVVLLF